MERAVVNEIKAIAKKEVAQYIQRRREQAGLTRRALARILGVNGNTLGYWESGYTEPRGSIIPLICMVCDAEQAKKGN